MKYKITLTELEDYENATDGKSYQRAARDVYVQTVDEVNVSELANFINQPRGDTTSRSAAKGASVTPIVSDSDTAVRTNDATL